MSKSIQNICGVRKYIMSRVLVTGGAGFLGSHLCEKLLNNGDDILCVDKWAREIIKEEVKKGTFKANLSSTN